MIVLPNLDWYLSISTLQQLSPRCPYASVYRCPRFYQSLSLLCNAGSTKIDPKEDGKIKESWEKTDVWPVTAEQATSVSGPEDESKHFSHFCPEVSFDRFGLFTTELHKYADEIDSGSAHKALLKEGALPDDWRWHWYHIEPMHYAECPLYSLLRLGKGRNGPKPTFQNIGLPDSITTPAISVTEADNLTAKMEMQENQTIWDKVMRHPVYVSIALLGSIASIISLWYVFSPGNSIDQGAKLESSPGSAVYQAGRDIVIQQQPPTANESLQHQVQPTNKNGSQPGQQDKNEIKPSDDASNGETSLSESGLYNEEHIRSRIDRALTAGNATRAIALLRKFRTEKARKEEAKHIFDYCIKNNKLKEADKVVSFLSPAEKKQAKQLVELEKMKGESK